MAENGNNKDKELPILILFIEVDENDQENMLKFEPRPEETPQRPKKYVN